MNIYICIFNIFDSWFIIMLILFKLDLRKFYDIWSLFHINSRGSEEGGNANEKVLVMNWYLEISYSLYICLYLKFIIIKI